MKQRILVAVIGIPLLLLVLCWAPHWATALLLAALTVIAAHELLAAVSGAEKTKSLWVLAGFMAVCTVFSTYAGMEAYKGTVLVAVPWLLCAAVALLFLLAVRWFGRENAIADASAMLDNAFAFLEEAFGAGQEMVIFITELTTNFYSVKFISENGSEKYYRYNAELLFDEKQKTILQDIEKAKTELNLLF